MLQLVHTETHMRNHEKGLESSYMTHLSGHEIHMLILTGNLMYMYLLSLFDEEKKYSNTDRL